MRAVVIGAHLRRDDVEPHATAIAVGYLFLSALEIPDEQPVGDRALLLRVAAMRAKLVEEATFIAIRYGFVASSDADAFAKCAAFLPKWKSVLEENRGNVEMTLKVAATSAQPRPDRRDFTSGADYLRALHAAANAVTIDPEFRRDVEASLLPLALKHRWSTRDEKSVELALLTPRERIAQINSAGESLRRPGVAFMLSGPWPLEVFADDDHE
ncbi:MAG TPA: GvpL/GvpF family gas vesicle protein [Thermoanaerobaculia bacterium]